MELSASSYQSPDPYHGGDGYRPTINAYQFGDAQAISTLAGLSGDLSTRLQFAIRAERLNQAQEAHDPDNPVWIYDSFNHSEAYNHSTFNDLVLSGLLGIRPQLTDTVIVHPLVPDSWDYFAIENLPYHGRNLTVLWDKDGSHYHQGAGLKIYIDGQLTSVRDRLQPVQAQVSPNHGAHRLPRLVNDAVNAFGGPTQPAEFPHASASYTSPYDDAQRAIDGENFYLDIPNTLDQLPFTESDGLVVGRLWRVATSERCSHLFLQ